MSKADGQIYYYDVNATSNFVANAPAVLGFDPTARFVDYIVRVAQRGATVSPTCRQVTSSGAGAGRARTAARERTTTRRRSRRARGPRAQDPERGDVRAALGIGRRLHVAHRPGQEPDDEPAVRARLRHRAGLGPQARRRGALDGEPRLVHVERVERKGRVGVPEPRRMQRRQHSDEHDERSVIPIRGPHDRPHPAAVVPEQEQHQDRQPEVPRPDDGVPILPQRPDGEQEQGVHEGGGDGGRPARARQQQAHADQRLQQRPGPYPSGAIHSAGRAALAPRGFNAHGSTAGPKSGLSLLTPLQK